MILTRRSLLQLLGIGSAAPTLRSGDAVAASVEAETEECAPPYSAPFERFFRSRGITPAHLAREAGYSRQHLLQLRFSRIQPSLACIARIVIGVRRLTGERVRPEHLFEAHVIGIAWRDARPTQLLDEERAEIRAAFARRALHELLGG